MITLQVILSAVFTSISGVFLWHWIKRRRLHFLVTCHLLTFWINILIYGMLSMVIHNLNFEYEVLLLLLFLILFYFFSFYLLSPKLKNLNTDPILGEIRQIPQWSITAILITWLLFKIYFYYKYGIFGFWVLAYREKLDISEIEIVTNMFISNLAFGAVLIYTVKVGSDIIIAIRNWFNTLLSSMSLLIFSFFNADLGLGARRTLIFVLVVFILSIVYTRKKLNLKHFLLGILITILMIQLAVLYQSTIRESIFPTAEWGKIFIVQKPVSSLTDFIGSERYSPLWLMHQIIYEQIENFRVGQGELFKQTIMNSIPRILSPKKKYVDQDELLWEMFNVPMTDLPTSVLISFQVEIPYIAYLILPLLLTLLYKGYKWLIFYSKRIGIFLTIVILGNIFLIMQSIEASIDQISTTIRTTFLSLILFWGFHKIRRIFKVKKAVWKYKL